MTLGDILFHATTKTQQKTETTSYSAGVDIWDHFDMLPVVEKCKITTHTTTFAHHKNPEVYYGERGSG
jgi:hypothetical protein